MSDASFPWLNPLWARLEHYRAQQRLPSALLISASVDLGQRALVDQFARSVFCNEPIDGGQGCGDCTACTLFDAGNYPDYLVLSPEPDSHVIKVDAVRQWCSKLAYNPQFEQHRIALIDQAHLMNRAAANSLLKTLEEPSRDTTIVLLSNRPAALPATIRSRCQLITVTAGEPSAMQKWLTDQGCESAVEYLHMAQGSPILARELWQSNALELHDKLFQSFTSLLLGRGDPLLVSELFLTHYPQPMLGFMSSWVMDLIRLKSGAGEAGIRSTSKLSDLKIAQSKLDFEQLFDLLQRIYQCNGLQQNQLNAQLVVEDLLLHCGPHGPKIDQFQRV